MLHPSLDFPVEVFSGEVGVGDDDEWDGEDGLLLVLHDDAEALEVEDGGGDGRDAHVDRVEGGDQQVDQQDVGHYGRNIDFVRLPEICALASPLTNRGGRWS